RAVAVHRVDLPVAVAVALEDDGTIVGTGLERVLAALGEAQEQDRGEAGCGSKHDQPPAMGARDTFLDPHRDLLGRVILHYPTGHEDATRPLMTGQAQRGIL